MNSNMVTAMTREVRDQTDQRQFSADRKKLLDQEMSRCIRLLTEYGSPQKVILFGTLAMGQVHEWSDIDLVVIEQTQLPFFQRIKKIRKLIKPKVGMDIMVYTPDEFDQLCIDRPFFREEIVANGKIVYENIRLSMAGICQTGFADGGTCHEREYL